MKRGDKLTVLDILRHLRAICKLLATLDGEGDPEAKPSRYARVYGPSEHCRLVAWVSVTPIYPDHEHYQPLNIIRGKAYRMKLAQVMQDEISNNLVGYKVNVRID